MYGLILMLEYLIIVLFIENLGGAVIGVLTLYVTQYVVEAPEWAPHYSGLYASICAFSAVVDSAF